MKTASPWILAAILSLPAALLASERTVPESEVPAAVRDAVQSKYSSAKVTAFLKEDEKGKTAYEAKLDNGVEVSFTPEGKVLVEESTIDPSALPDPVRTGLRSSKYRSWQVQKAEKVVEGEDASKPRYELALQNGARRAEVVFDPSGGLIKEETPRAHPAHKK